MFVFRYDAQQRVYWEETQRYMRNNAYYASRPHKMDGKSYRIPVMICAGLVGLGIVYFFVALG